MISLYASDFLPCTYCSHEQHTTRITDFRSGISVYIDSCPKEITTTSENIMMYV